MIFNLFYSRLRYDVCNKMYKTNHQEYKMFLKILASCTLILGTLSYAAPMQITIGIAPHSSTRVIMDTHQDLRSFLEEHFKRPVQITTAKSFSEFAERSNKGGFYDLVLTSPNLALLAKKFGGYTPLMTYTKGLSAIILTKDKEILKSKKYPLRVVGLDPVSFATMTAQDWLEKQGFDEDKELKYTYTSASDSAAAILINNEADMTIMSLPNYLKLSDDVRQKVQVLYQSTPQPSRIFLAKDANGITLKEWKNALEAFSKSQEGAKHLSATKLEGFKTVAPHELDNLDKMANKTLKRLNEQ